MGRIPPFPLVLARSDQVFMQQGSSTGSLPEQQLAVSFVLNFFIFFFKDKIFEACIPRMFEFLLRR